MIDFELSEGIQTQRQMVHAVAEQAMRPIAREYDEREHEKPWDFLNMMWQVSSGNPVSTGGEKKPKEERAERNLFICVSIEELSWGDAGLYLSIPNAGLGGAAVAAAGAPDQRARSPKNFTHVRNPNAAACEAAHLLRPARRCDPGAVPASGRVGRQWSRT